MFLFRDFVISNKKEIRIAILNIYGLSWHKSNLILNKLGVKNYNSAINLNEYYIFLIIYLLRGFILSDSKIKRNIDNNINKAITNGSYKGTRHKLALPVRGQRSRTNSATQRSKRTI